MKLTVGCTSSHSAHDVRKSGKSFPDFRTKDWKDCLAEDNPVYITVYSGSTCKHYHTANILTLLILCSNSLLLRDYLKKLS